MFKKLLAGFIVMAVALTGMPMTSFAAVQVGDNLKLFGDFRLRLEYDDSNRTADPDGDGDFNDKRERPRIRLRFGAKYQTAIEPLSFGFRLATGSTFNSQHNNLATASVTGIGSTDGFGVDRAYAKLQFLESGMLVVGKFGHPFWQQTEQFWDEDIQPEGYAAAYTASMGDAGSLTAAVAYYYIRNNDWQESLFDNDTATVWQVAWKGNFQDLGLTVAGTGFHTSDGDNSGDWAGVGNDSAVPPFGATGLRSGACVDPVGPTPSPCAGGVTNDVAFYMISGQIKGKFDNIGLLVGGDYHLSSADIAGVSDDHDRGFVIQGRVKVDQWGVRYYYYDIEEFAVPSYAGTMLSQDNFPNASNSAPVGFTGHRIQFDYKIAKGVSADFRIYLNEAKSDNYGYGEAAGAERNRYQLNFNTKF